MEGSLHPLCLPGSLRKSDFHFSFAYGVFNDTSLGRWVFSPLILTFGQLIFGPVFPFLSSWGEKVVRYHRTVLLGGPVCPEAPSCSAGFCTVSATLPHLTRLLPKERFSFLYSSVQSLVHWYLPFLFCARTGASEMTQLPFLSSLQTQRGALRRADVVGWTGADVGPEGEVRRILSHVSIRPRSRKRTQK